MNGHAVFHLNDKQRDIVTQMLKENLSPTLIFSGKIIAGPRTLIKYNMGKVVNNQTEEIPGGCAVSFDGWTNCGGLIEEIEIHAIECRLGTAQFVLEHLFKINLDQSKKKCV